MAIAQKIVRYAMQADASLGTFRRSLVGEKTGIISVLFHNIFSDEIALKSGLAYPQEGVTQEQFRTFITYWREVGYNFVTTQHVLSGLDLSWKYIILTFDDGYRSILDILPILEEYQVPVILFVTSKNIETGHSYWPDIVYREELVIGESTIEANNLVEALKCKNSSEIRQFILERYGEAACFSVKDIARPLTEKELTSLVNHPLIEIGNHTMNHTDLTLLKLEEIRSEISGCQQAVKGMTGELPVAISYPFGKFNSEVLSVAQSEGLQLGFTCEEGKNQLPLSENALKIRRYDFLGDTSPSAQCDRFRSDVHFCWPIVKNMLLFLTQRLRLFYTKRSI